jgi:hypothetical protein
MARLRLAGAIAGLNKTAARGRPDLIWFKPERRKVLRSIANLDAANLPAIAIPEALANETADRLLDIDRRRRVINRRRRRWPRRQSATEQRSTNQSTAHAGGDLTVLRSCRYR